VIDHTEADVVREDEVRHSGVHLGGRHQRFTEKLLHRTLRRLPARGLRSRRAGEQHLVVVLACGALYIFQLSHLQTIYNLKLSHLQQLSHLKTYPQLIAN